jgi:hypothetical protein
MLSFFHTEILSSPAVTTTISHEWVSGPGSQLLDTLSYKLSQQTRSGFSAPLPVNFVTCYWECIIDYWLLLLEGETE